MSAGATSVLHRLPAHGDWSFGGFPYAVEPLWIPPPETSDADVGDASGRPAESARRCREILGLADRPGPRPTGRPGSGGTDVEATDAEATDALYWFRWITGHQVSFVLWRLIAQEIGAAAEPPPGGPLRLARHVRAYSAMLLYTSSCPSAVYHGLIRPSMYRQHRAFSGTWAPDYRPVRSVLRGRRSAWNASGEGQDLARAVEQYKRIHAGIAVRLVPDGRSLLQAAAVSGRDRDVAAQDVLYDNYFMTLRAALPRADVLDQLLRRLTAVSQDLAVNGLYPDGDAAVGLRPVELRAADVRAAERDVVRTVHAAARAACEPADVSGGVGGRERAS